MSVPTRAVKGYQSFYQRSLAIGAVLAAFMLAVSTVYADWVVLKDGSAAQVLKRQGGVTVVSNVKGEQREVLNNQISKRLTDASFNRYIDTLLNGMTRSRNAQEKLKALGPASVDRLIYHINGKVRNRKLFALVMLQHVWDEKAADAVRGSLNDKDKDIRKIAMILANRYLEVKDYSESLLTRIDDPDPTIAGAALTIAEEQGPDLNRMIKAIQRPRLWPYLTQSLQRYHSDKLMPMTRRMLAKGKDHEKIIAIQALIHQMDASPQVRQDVLTETIGYNALLRDIAAEYFRWHGQLRDVSRLKLKLKVERDPYVKASLTAAIEAIGLRGKRFPVEGELSEFKWPKNPAASYQLALAKLEQTPTVIMQREVVKMLAAKEAFEPYFKYVDSKIKFDRERNEALLKLKRAAFGYPEQPIRVEPDSESKPPIARKLMGPVRDFLDNKQKSFGHVVKAAGPFNHSVHIGYDAGWRQDQSTVVSIGDGVVRSVRVGAHSWGGIVIIEHTDEKGEKFCSLYSHLGPLICVNPGQHVTMGQKIGVLGRTYTWEGGGYVAHIHFGIHMGPYGGHKVGGKIRVRFKGELQLAEVVKVIGEKITVKLKGGSEIQLPQTGDAYWVTGYISQKQMQSGNHGWVDPQAFIRARR